MQWKSREEVNSKLAGILGELVGDGEIGKEIAFHITDWRENLEEIAGIYEFDREMSDAQIEQIIIRFLAHVPNHVAAAKKLIGLGPIENVFNVNVTEE